VAGGTLPVPPTPVNKIPTTTPTGMSVAADTRVTVGTPVAARASPKSLYSATHHVITDESGGGDEKHIGLTSIRCARSAI